MISPRLLLSASGLLLLSVGVFLATRPEEPVHVFPEEEIASQGERATTHPQGVRADTPYGAWLDVELSYQARFESTAEITTGESTQATTHTLSGRQLVRIVERTHEGITASYSWPDLELRLMEDGALAEEEGIEALVLELSRPVLVHHDLEGNQQALRFTTGTGAEARNWARNMIASQRAPVAAVAPEGFDLVEADAAGRSRVHYEVTALTMDTARVLRTKREALDGVTWGGEMRAPAVIGDGIITLSDGWIHEVNWQERSILEVKELMFMFTQSFTAEVVREGIKRFERGALDGLELEEEWRSFDGLTEREGSFTEASSRLNIEASTDADADALLSHIVTLGLADDRGAGALLMTERLALLIADDPELSSALLSTISSGALPEEAAARVLRALASADTHESQAVLRELFTARETPSELREPTARALFQLHTVSPETVAVFQEVLADEDSAEELRDASWPLLGYFASTGSVPELTAQLVEMESSAAEAGELIPWLEALGNTRSPTILESVQGQLERGGVSTRRSAVRALRHLEDAETTQVLVAVADRDRNSTVRGEALALLATREHSDAITALGELLSDEPEAMVRRAALDGLSQRSMTDEIQSVLSNLASSDPDAALRAYALTLLGS